MTQKGTVIDVDKSTNTLLVRIEREGACKGCTNEKTGCALGGACSVLTVSAVDGCGAEVGDTVLLKAPAQQMLLSYAAVFLVPLLIAFTGGFSVYAVTEAELFSAVCFFALLIIVFLILRAFFEKRMALQVKSVAFRIIPKHEGKERTE